MSEKEAKDFRETTAAERTITLKDSADVRVGWCRRSAGWQ
jgi:hypothetical protein